MYADKLSKLVFSLNSLEYYKLCKETWNAEASIANEDFCYGLLSIKLLHFHHKKYQCKAVILWRLIDFFGVLIDAIKPEVQCAL